MKSIRLTVPDCSRGFLNIQQNANIFKNHLPAYPLPIYLSNPIYTPVSITYLSTYPPIHLSYLSHYLLYVYRAHLLAVLLSSRDALTALGRQFSNISISSLAIDPNILVRPSILVQIIIMLMPSGTILGCHYTRLGHMAFSFVSGEMCQTASRRNCTDQPAGFVP